MSPRHSPKSPHHLMSIAISSMFHRNPPRVLDVLVTELGANCADPQGGSSFGRMAEQSLTWYAILTQEKQRLMDNHAFQQEDGHTFSGHTFSGSQWLEFSGKEAIKHEFFFARTSTTFTCMFAPFKGTLEETWSRLSDGSCRYSTQMKGTLVSQRMLL